jgi:hypothetical protein
MKLNIADTEEVITKEGKIITKISKRDGITETHSFNPKTKEVRIYINRGSQTLIKETINKEEHTIEIDRTVDIAESTFAEDEITLSSKGAPLLRIPVLDKDLIGNLEPTEECFQRISIENYDWRYKNEIKNNMHGVEIKKQLVLKKLELKQK